MADRVVFDTNVRLAALLWRGAGYKCWLAARSGLVDLVYCPQMVADVLLYRGHQSLCLVTTTFWPSVSIREYASSPLASF